MELQPAQDRGDAPEGVAGALQGAQVARAGELESYNKQQLGWKVDQAEPSRGVNAQRHAVRQSGMQGERQAARLLARWAPGCHPDRVLGLHTAAQGRARERPDRFDE